MSTTSQWLFRNSTITNAATVFSPLQDAIGGNTNATETILQAPCTEAGNFLTIVVNLSAAPGGVTSYRFQLSINGSPSAILDVTITGASTSGSASGTVAVVAGDLLTVKITPTGAANAANAQISLEFEPTTANHYIYPCWYGGGQIKGTAPAYNRMLFGNNADKTTDGFDTSTRDIAPFAGRITAFRVHLSVAPGAGKSWDIILVKNGVEIPESAVNIAGTSVNASLSLSVSVAAGDFLTFKLKTANGTPSNTRVNWCTTFVPTAGGLFAIGGVSSTSRTSSTFVAAYGQLANESGTEGNVQLVVPAALRLLALYAAVGTAAGATKDWTFTDRINTANGTITFSLGASGLAGQDTAHIDALAANDLLAVHMVATNTPTGCDGWAICFSATTSGTPSTAQYTTFGVITRQHNVVLDAPTTSYYFEAIFSATNGATAHARLFNVTDNAAVTGSDVTTTNASATRVRSSAITLSSDKVYRAEFGGLANGETYTCYAADIIADVSG